MTQALPPAIPRATYHRIYDDAEGGSHVDTETAGQHLARGAPPAALFPVSEGNAALKYRFCTFQPGWIGDWPPHPARQFPSLVSGAVEMETTDGTVRRPGPGDLILLEGTPGRRHLTGNTGDGYATFLVVPIPAA